MNTRIFQYYLMYNHMEKTMYIGDAIVFFTSYLFV